MPLRYPPASGAKQAAALQALNNEAYIGELVDYLRFAEEQLRSAQAGEIAGLDPEFRDGLGIVIGTLAEVLDPLARTAYFLSLRQRKRGRPAAGHKLNHDEIRAVVIVRHRPPGQKKEAAVQSAMASTGFSRSQVFAALRRFRESEARLRDAFGIPESEKLPF